MTDIRIRNKLSEQEPPFIDGHALENEILRALSPRERE